jgi:hypothetical protein
MRSPDANFIPVALSAVQQPPLKKTGRLSNLNSVGGKGVIMARCWWWCLKNKARTRYAVPSL